MPNQKNVPVTHNEDREWLYKFQTWESKCPKTIADFDDDHEAFIEWAYSRVWLQPNKYMCEYLTQEEGKEDRPPLPDHLDPWVVRFKKQRKSAMTHSQFEEMTDS